MQSIISWFHGFFPSRKSEARSSAGIPLRDQKARSRISYSPDLVPALKDDHQHLLEVYSEVGNLLQAGRYAEVPLRLRDFKTRLDVHLLNENLRFYCYLEQSLADSPEELALMKDFRREMNEIARVVVNFLRKYQMAGVSAANKETFGGEYRQIGAALAARIDREESGLYSLYHP